MTNKFFITGPLAVNPDSVIKDFTFFVDKGRFSEEIPVRKVPKIELDKDTIAYPALINIHDHLRGNYLPRVGPPKNKFYLNWSEWDKDLKASPVYEERSHISVEEIYMLGAYKNLLSGVVTVQDHYPHELNDEYLGQLPMFAKFGYSLAHECSSFDLKWGDGIQIEHARAVKKNIPFITHLEEGFDEESQSGIEILQALDCLDMYSVLIHCIGFTDADIKAVSAAGSHTVWCPASNLFMFNTTCKIRKMLKAGINVSIGTDSTHTGSINLLEEMRYARQVYQRLYNEQLDAKTVMKMVTSNAAKALRMDHLIGTLTTGFRADILVTAKKCEDPYENLMQTGIEDIKLLMYGGKPVYADHSFKPLFEGSVDEFSEVKINKSKKVLVGKPQILLKKIWKKIGKQKFLSYLPLEM